MSCCHRNEVDREQILAKLAEELNLSPAQIEATSTWRRFGGTGDSLEVVELVLDIEEELSEGGGKGT